TEHWVHLEPLGRTAGYLERLGILDESQREQIHAEAKETIAAAVKEMEAIDHPDESILFDGIYTSGRPWTFDDGLGELRSVARPPEVKPLGPQPGSSTGDVETIDRGAQ
ncbi:MAG: hypothetical protein M3161_07485, partial [Actinomycetota bacterium]|nr:hypothetical protein [Actinomycetota bacterium]